MKKIALILAIILMLTPIFASCDKTDKVSVESETKKQEVSETEFSIDSLPELDMNKEEFRSYGAKNSSGTTYYDYETGDLMNDANYQRKVAIEEKYNVQIVRDNSTLDNPAGEIKRFILSDDKTYDVFHGKQDQTMTEMILDGYFVEWGDLEYVDYTKPYWNTALSETMNFCGKVYYMAGDYSLSTYNSTNVIMFNKDLFNDLGIEYPWQDVYDYTWTIDKLIEISKQGYNDLNGSTQFEREEDRTGYAGWYWEMYPALYFGMGGQTIITDEDNMPVLNIGTERTVKILDKMIELFDGQNAWSYGTNYGTHNKAFDDGRLLMRDTMLYWLEMNRGLEFEASIVPYPMLDEDQGKYYSRSGPSFSSCIYVPVTNESLESTGIILEAMAIEGYNRIRPVYYDITLDLKSTSDPETRDMVDIVLASAVYQNETMLTPYDMNKIVASKTNTFTSWFASREEYFEGVVKDIADYYAA
ncbi:MAG: extracellular solute-binding protein [Ruminococcaceae bacterium]|nr:extracellular solute-binding protein [Oscillospiraceae bacterium]